MRTNLFRTLLFVSAIVTMSAASAHAEKVFRFKAITNNNPDNVKTGEAQLKLTITDVTSLINDGQKYLEFLFENIGPKASSITNIRIDDTGLPSLTWLAAYSDSGSTVQLLPVFMATPAPGYSAVHGSTPDYFGLNATAMGTSGGMGIDPGEWVRIRLRINDNSSFSKFTRNINGEEGKIKIGLTVRGFADGGSEQFVAVPSPSAVAGGTILLLIGAWYVRRHRGANAPAD